MNDNELIILNDKVYKIRVDAADEFHYYGVDIERNNKVLLKVFPWWRKKMLIGMVNDININCIVRMKYFDIFIPYTRMGLVKCDVVLFDPVSLEAYENITQTTNDTIARYDFATLQEYESFMELDEE